MTQHGFARHNEFETNQVSDTEVIFSLKSNDEIIKQYPFLFELNVTYKLVENKLKCHIEVKNTDHQPIYFQVGGHPAFACPFMENESSNDYYLEFSENETCNRKIIDVEKRGMSRVEKPFMIMKKDFLLDKSFLIQMQLLLKILNQKILLLNH